MKFKLIDLQVNGYKGVSFTDINLTYESCRNAIKEYFFDAECEKILPTVITTSQKVYEKVLPILGKIVKEFPEQVPGLHLEGPFISKECKGAHDEQYIREIDIEFMEKLVELSDNTIKLITIAAELKFAKPFIRYCGTHDIKVSLGHQMANLEQINTTADIGATLMTHLGNGMPQKIDRHDNPLLGGLICRKITPMIIPDGFHLPEHLIRFTMDVKGVNNVICVSDISPLGGLEPGEYSGKAIGMDNTIRLESDGKLHIPSLGCLAGSSQTIKQCAEYLLKESIADEEEIHQMFYVNPLKVLE